MLKRILLFLKQLVLVLVFVCMFMISKRIDIIFVNDQGTVIYFMLFGLAEEKMQKISEVKAGLDDADVLVFMCFVLFISFQEESHNFGLY